MFGIIKWIIIFGLIGTVWFVYDVSTKLSPSEKQALKKDAIEALDNGNTEPLSAKIKEKMDERKNSFFESIKQRLRNLLDNDEGH